MNKLIMGMGLTLFFLLLMGYAQTIQHEEVHSAIYKNYGVNSTIKLMFGVGGLTTPDKNTAYLCNETCEMLHSQNEIVGYNVQVIICSIFLSVLVIIIFNYMGEK